MSRRFFFGYGSLVNRATHAYGSVTPARISGWRRAWKWAPTRNIPYLTAVRSAGSEIDGLIAEVDGPDWHALDERERAYDRFGASDAVSHPLPFVPDIVIYAIPDAMQSEPTTQNPVLLSYLDVVVQGYAREFGAEGIDHFFDTTDGWSASILDDRANPIYPRHQTTTKSERDEVDGRLENLGVTRLSHADYLRW